MREIKFRAWDGKKMLQHIYFHATPEGWIWADNNCTVGVKEVMQYTGLKDENGVDVYEGDIVEIKDAGRCRVDYLDHSMKFYFQTLEGYEKQFTVTPEQIEVIGNICENSDLLV